MTLLSFEQSELILATIFFESCRENVNCCGRIIRHSVVTGHHRLTSCTVTYLLVAIG